MEASRQLSGDGFPRSGLVGRLAALAIELAGEQDLAGVARRVVDAALREIAGAQSGSLVIQEHGRVNAAACSDDVAARAETLQSATSQGPSMDAATRGVAVGTADLVTDERWPEFVMRAGVELGVRSILSVPLAVGAVPVGALSVYARPTAAFPAEASDIAAVVAAHAAVAIVACNSQVNLRTALASRDVIGQAKGLLMERHKISAEEAFALLRTTSQRSNRRVRDLAEELARTGELPQPPPGQAGDSAQPTRISPPGRG